jgi:epoxyqueuosine reductase
VRRSNRGYPTPTVQPDGDYVALLASIAAGFGVTRIGVASADVMGRARAELLRRRDLGLHDGMQFTYKNPQRSTDPTQAVAGAQSVFVAALPYPAESDQPDTAPDVPARVARYAWTDHYEPLRAGLQAVALQLRKDGWRAVRFADDNSMVDREIAYRAGIGWFGKNANLLIPGAGSWFVLGSVVTTAPLPVTTVLAADGCGSCRRCLDGCPTGAIIEPGVVDAARCLAWLLQKPGIFPRQYRQALGNRIYGCDDCQEVCPPTVRIRSSSISPTRSARQTAGAASAPLAGGVRVSVPGTAAMRELEPVIDALDLLDATDEQIIDRWGRWYITDRDPRWLRRNALIVVGNTVNGTEPSAAARARVRVTLGRYLADDDAVLRAHAVWAARMLSFDALLPATDADPDVMAELGAPL